ncbi:MAG: leucine-rich repeat domain-containing protein [Bacteroidales bacterium]|nr:leucine-rich repeat domain-containing protein [Bacteroidales bacterium]
MKKLSVLAAFLAFVPSCTKMMEQNTDPEQIQEPAQIETEETVVFSATTEGATKTVLSEDGGVYHVLWATGDVINVNGTNLTLQSEDQPAGYGPGEKKGNFAGSKPLAAGSGPKYKAVYPNTLRDKYGYFNLPGEQPYLAGGVAAFPMYAESDDESFSFKNLCGLIQLNLKGDKSVSTISLVDKDPSEPKPMSGRFNVIEDAAVLTAGTNGTALVCETPVALNTETFTPFFITVPAATYGKLRIIIEASDGTVCTLNSKSAITITRSQITPVNISSPNFKDEAAKITYTTSNTSKVDKYAAGADAAIFGSGLSVVSHNYDSESRTGVITFSGPVTSVGYYAFRSVSNLKTMTIPNTVISIGERAFESCGNLESVNFPRSLSIIGTYAFVNSSKFVPDDLSHITTIYAGAFQNVKLSGTLTLGDNFTRIDFDAFRNTKITEVVINHKPETLGTGVFLDCSVLASVTINDDMAIPNYMFKNCPLLASVTFNGDITTIGEESFNLCKALTDIELPSTVTSIGRWGFASCYALTSIILPSGLTTLTQQAFESCTGLVSVTFPTSGSFTTIPSSCFYGCSDLTTTVIPSNVTSIGQNAFKNCGFTELPEGWGRSGISYGDRPFDGCPIASITFPDNWTSIPNNFCWGWKSLSEVHFGTGVTTVGANVFRECTALTDGAKVVIPANVNSIGSYCFYQSGLTSLPSGINRADITLSDHVFASTPLTTVDISNWTVIPNSTFSESKSLISATLGSSLTAIQQYAFYNCTSFTTVALPASLNEMGSYCFHNTALADIPAGLHDCSSFGEHIFSNTLMTGITLPDGMTTIPNYMFAGCASLTTVDLNDVTTLGNFAFSGCGLLDSVTAPEVLTVGEYAFYRNNALVSIELPSVVTVRSNAFTESSHLETVDFGSHVTSIGQDCINNITTMQAVYIRNGASVCSLNTRLNNYPAHPVPLIYVPEGLLDSYKGAAGWSNYREYFRGLDIAVSLPPVTSMQLGDGSVPYYSIPGIINALCDNGGTLTFLADNTSELTFTGTATGVIDMNGHSQNKVFWMQNTGGSITIRNGTFTQTGDCFDGKTGFADGYGGTVILENMTVKGTLWTDSHPYIIRSGDYKQIRNMKKNDVTSPGSGTVTIEGGRFQSFYNYSSSGWTYGDYYISGGKFAFDPAAATNVTITSGYHVEANTDDDSATYPYKVAAD